MRIISLDNKLDSITIGVIGTEKQGEEIKSRVLASCPDALRGKVVFLVPKDGVSPEVMIHGAGKTSRKGGSVANILWLGCVIPETLPENVVWPSNILFLTDFVERGNPFFETLSFVPNFVTVDEFALLVSGTIKREADNETVDMELAKLRAEKFKLHKQAETLEKAVVNAGRTVENINALWRGRTRSLKLLFTVLFVLSSVLGAWLAFGVWNPPAAARILAGVHLRTFGTLSDFSHLVPSGNAGEKPAAVQPDAPVKENTGETVTVTGGSGIPGEMQSGDVIPGEIYPPAPIPVEGADGAESGDEGEDDSPVAGVPEKEEPAKKGK